MPGFSNATTSSSTAHRSPNSPSASAALPLISSSASAHASAGGFHRPRALLAVAPAADGACDVGDNAGDDVGGRVEEPLQTDPVEDSSDEAHFGVDLGRAEWRHIAAVDRL